MSSTTRRGTQFQPRDWDDGEHAADASVVPGDARDEQGALFQEQQEQQVSVFGAAALFMAKASPAPPAVAGRDVGQDQTSPGLRQAAGAAAGPRTEGSLGPSAGLPRSGQNSGQRSPGQDAWGPRTTTGGAFGGGTADAEPRRGLDAPDGLHPERGARQGHKGRPVTRQQSSKNKPPT